MFCLLMIFLLGCIYMKDKEKEKNITDIEDVNANYAKQVENSGSSSY